MYIMFLLCWVRSVVITVMSTAQRLYCITVEERIKTLRSMCSDLLAIYRHRQILAEICKYP
jgi:hypothetical protein